MRRLLRLAVVALLSLCPARAQETCYSSDVEPYVKYGTKTAYEFVNDKNSQHHLIPNCEPVMLWSLNRPGARLPDAAKMRELQDLEQFQRSVVSNYDGGAIGRVTNARLCRRDVDMLRDWRWKPRGNTSPGDLTTQGYLDTQVLARTWKSKYPNIMTNDPSDYLFKFVKERAYENSFQAYAEGVFGQRAASISIPKEHNEALLQPFKHCATWSKNVEKNNDTNAQVNIFVSKMEFRNMVMNISSRLGYTYSINNRDVYRMWEMCRLDKAWELAQPSAWCAAFTKEDLKRLEYIEDLKSYYGSGYGSPLNAKLGCAPVKDMVQFFSKYVNNPSFPPQPKAVVSFVPSAMLLMTLTAMGAYQDTVPLTGDNYHTPLMQNRVWRTSDIDPFGANLVAVLYRCRDQGDNYRVMFFLNERPVLLNGCAVGLCDWSYVKSRFGHVADHCDVKGFCQNGVGVASVNVAAMLLLVITALKL